MIKILLVGHHKKSYCLDHFLFLESGNYYEQLSKRLFYTKMVSMLDNKVTGKKIAFLGWYLKKTPMILMN